jgi:hypothetical protein
MHMREVGPVLSNREFVPSRAKKFKRFCPHPKYVSQTPYTIHPRRQLISSPRTSGREGDGAGKGEGGGQ